MTLEQLLQHAAHLFTVYANYSFARRAMTIPAFIAEILFERRLMQLPGVAATPFAFVLEEGQRQGFWRLDTNAEDSSPLVVLQLASARAESFAHRME